MLNSFAARTYRRVKLIPRRISYSLFNFYLRRTYITHVERKTLFTLNKKPRYTNLPFVLFLVLFFPLHSPQKKKRKNKKHENRKSEHVCSSRLAINLTPKNEKQFLIPFRCSKKFIHRHWRSSNIFFHLYSFIDSYISNASYEITFETTIEKQLWLK